MLCTILNQIWDFYQIALPSSVSLIDSQSNPPPTLRSVSLQINVYHSSLCLTTNQCSPLFTLSHYKSMFTTLRSVSLQINVYHSSLCLTTNQCLPLFALSHYKSMFTTLHSVSLQINVYHSSLCLTTNQCLPLFALSHYKSMFTTLRSVSLQINVYHSSLFFFPSSLPKDNICSTTSLSHRNLMPRLQTSSPHFSPSPSFLSSPLLLYSSNLSLVSFNQLLLCSILP
jgi:hypothetical protein